MAAELDFRNTNALWASVLVETLVRCGVRCSVISPGSRSTPLTHALARHPGVEAIPVLDERSAGFFALGVAKQTRRPSVLVCTSGTAAANYFPAIIEASESGTPLLVITADRPPEMRDCASGQTIDQQKLYGGYAAFYHELAVPQAEVAMLRYLRQTVAHACEKTVSPFFGVSHLNTPFRDPLPPIEDSTAQALSDFIDDGFFSHLSAVSPPARSSVAWQRPTTARGLIVAGPAPMSHPVAHASAVRQLAEGLRWPVLADALSPARHHGPFGVPVVTAYDAILRNERAARALTPRTVICVGGWPTSKALRRWIGGSGAEVLMVTETGQNRDALHGRTRHLPLPVEALKPEGSPVGDDAYLAAWEMAVETTERVLAEAFSREDALSEAKVSYLLAQELPDKTPVFVASSMSVRYAEYFWTRSGRRHELFFNRGANGIDGTLSTAMGIAHGNVPAVLLTGDLALLHDSNGFLNRRHWRGSLTIVLINNRGGGIFEHLPIARFDPPFEEFFATPQEVDFSRLCGAHGVTHEAVSTWERLRELVAKLPDSGIRVLEISTDRKKDVDRCRQLIRSAAAAVDLD